MGFKCKRYEQWTLEDLNLDLNLSKTNNWQLNSEKIVQVSLAVKKHCNKKFVQLPFCNTLESEALGAIVDYGDLKTNSRIKNCVYENSNDLNMEFQNLNCRCTTPRMDAMIESIRTLKKMGETVIFNVTGPITILSSLIELKTILKLNRKDEETLTVCINSVFEFLKYYIEMIEKSGADLISYGDPVGNMEILGQNYFQKLSKPLQLNLLRQFENMKIKVHVCGLLSSILNDDKEINIEKGGIFLLNQSKSNENKIYGLSCIGHW